MIDRRKSGRVVDVEATLPQRVAQIGAAGIEAFPQGSDSSSSRKVGDVGMGLFSLPMARLDPR
jgi:hypothetical protein